MLSNDDDEPMGEKIAYNDGHTALQGKVLKRRLYTYNYITPCFSPEWVERKLILRGYYIYRLAQVGESETEWRTKGCPIPVTDVKIQVVDDAYDEEGYEVKEHSICISTLRKVYCFAFESQDERSRWVQALAEQKQKAIKQKLGHMPIEAWEKKTNVVGERLSRQSATKRDADERVTYRAQQVASFF